MGLQAALSVSISSCNYMTTISFRGKFLNLEPGVLAFRQHISLLLGRIQYTVCLSEQTKIMRVTVPLVLMFSKVYIAY